ncbi:Mbov_0397 family ICE element conjugal transfer ATPase [Mycoplasma sp. 'Moose RK']|uniref:Mbov_0397 family ICE element conjugal transfer ATPase n=1 Tax=Mycoplasma sp. 'Moose RK' TaxID=2780095 RepID=UPI0018C334E6|nr:DUF87 domain-containing protein [Mycoplasma sp. 'Moose RK']MBG0730746.1 DUF87 domain-containing protein [Mycoplasma sp. 'Moose RK']MBG0731048.1 DUF87 domain-containing protein [Mycoplasma sp. 'Moose RK']
MKKQIQNKAISKINLHIFRNFNIWDLLVLSIVIIFALVFGFTINVNLNFLIKILIVILFFAFVGLPLLFNFPSQKARGWQILVYWLRFISMPKKYSINANGSNNTKNLIPYIGIKNDFLFNGKSYVGGLKIQGIDIFAYDLETQSNIFNNFAKIINNINKKISIIKIAAKNDIEENQKFLDKEFTNCKINANEEICEGYYEDLNLTFEGQLKFNYFLVVYDFEIKELELELLQIKSQLAQLEIVAEKLKIENLLDLSLKILNSNDEVDKDFVKEIVNLNHEIENIPKNKLKEIAKKTGELKDKIQSIFALDEIKWHSKYFKSNNKFFSLQSFSELPLELPPFWANTFFNSDSNIVWNIEKMSDKDKEKILNKAHNILSLNQMDENRNILLKRKGEFEQQALENVVDVAASGQNLFYSTFLFINCADSRKELDNLEYTNINLIKSVNAIPFSLRFKQLFAYLNIFFRQNDNLKEYMEMPTNNITWGFPFTLREFNDNNFNALGLNYYDNTPLFFDQFYQKGSRKNSNLFILGTSGSGKTTITKKLITYNISLGNSVIVLDPQNEYWKIGEKLGANVIHLNSSGQSVFNPLQIRKIFNPSEDDRIINADLIALNLSKLETFFQIVFPNISNTALIAIISCVKKLYDLIGFYEIEEDISKLENEDYPIIDDLIKVIKESEFSYLPEMEKQVIIANFEASFDSSSILGRMFNGVSNTNEINTKFSIFNVAALMNLEKRVYQAAFFLALSFIQGQISEFYLESNRKIVLVVDEGHKFIDESNLFALNFLFDTAKTIRKYNGSLIITTQNPGDFAISGEAARKSEAIIENCQYAFFFNLKSNDIEKVDKLFSSSGGLTKEEKSFINLAQIGEFLLTVNTVDRFKLRAYFNDVEKQYFFDKGNKAND